MANLIILPHWRIEGGAGYYIRDLIKSLQLNGNVNVAGPYAEDYEGVSIQCKYLDKLALQCLPAYKGIGLAAILYHIFISTFRAISIIAIPRSKIFNSSFNTLVLTSSVQAIGIPIARWLFPESRIAILIQENVCLSQGFGRLTKFFLTRADIIVSITETWAEHARENQLDPIVLPNSYELGYSKIEDNVHAVIESDLLYVGGGATIKGFDNLIAALPELIEIPGRRIIFLGRYTDEQRIILDRIREDAQSDAQLNIIGFVPDIRPYLQGTKLLVLPIGSPHFCRPAIEAGFFGKTFVIPNFPELGDFVFDNINCLTYPADNFKHFIDAVNILLAESSRRKKLGEQNRRIAQGFILNSNNKDIIAKIF